MKKRIFAMIVLVLFLSGCVCYKAEDGTFHQVYCENEIKFCSSNGMELYDNYVINGNQIIECTNKTGIAKYQFSNSKQESDNLGTGILIGWLLFGK